MIRLNHSDTNVVSKSGLFAITNLKRRTLLVYLKCCKVKKPSYIWIVKFGENRIRTYESFSTNSVIKQLKQRNGGQNIFVGRKDLGELRNCVFKNVCTYLSTYI